MYTCIAIDDQQESIDLISDHVSQIPQLTLEFSSCSPLEAVAYLDKNKPDIIFLDIQMPKLNGLELIETLHDKWGVEMPEVVLVTGYDEHTLEGFELGVSDYILKPVTFKRFKKAVDRIINKLNKQVTEKPSADFIFIDNNNQKIKLHFEEILYIEGARNYVSIFVQGKSYLVYKTLSSMMDVLPANKFMRIQKSYVVAIDLITAIKGNRVVLYNENKDIEIPIGLTFKNKVLKRLNVV